MGKLYFYQKADKELFKEAITEIYAKIYKAVLFNQTAGEKHQYGDEYDCSIEKLRHVHKKILEDQGIKSETINYYLSKELELSKKESEQVEDWMNSYILEKYNELRVICKTPHWTINGSDGQEKYVPSYIMQHIFSFLGSCSLWSGNPISKDQQMGITNQQLADIESMLFAQDEDIELTGEQLMEYTV